MIESRSMLTVRVVVVVADDRDEIYVHSDDRRAAGARQWRAEEVRQSREE